ncbi:MAG: hypothetical protein IJB98_00575 [Clostridia bacterium]|nr:hypothetical protein [Clostridia bacterium]
MTKTDNEKLSLSVDTRDNDGVAKQEHTKTFVELQDDKNFHEKVSKTFANDKIIDKDTGHEYPSRIIYLGKKLSVSRSRLWYVQSFGAMTGEELQGWYNINRTSLSIDEREVLELYLKSLAGDPAAKNMLWQLHLELFKAQKQVFIEETRKSLLNGNEESTTRLESLLREIGDKVDSVSKGSKSRVKTRTRKKSK